MSGQDLISRMDAIQACQVGPSDEWSKATKSGYSQAATDCALNILRIEAAIDHAAIREAALREAAEICSDLAVGYALHKGAPMALADAKRDILALIDKPAPDHSAGAGNMIDNPSNPGG